MTRRDARENRERVLDAAIAVFGEHGTSASTELIAERAGCGIGTVFRHFPTKQELLAAVLERMLAQLADHARSRAEERDAGAAFFGVLEHAIAHAPIKTAVAEGLAGGGIELGRRAWDGGLRDAIAVLLERAQAAGAVRLDIGVPEVIAVLVGASRAAEYVGVDGAIKKRTIAVLLDGLRPRPARRRR